MFLSVGTRMEVAPRVEQTWVRRVGIDAAQFDARTDVEEVVVDL